ncbi:MAG: hypothetical protein J5490_07100 [Bacteroidales bacterium]|nr:hypothetical protein [Bacteroidales bacterium]
MKKTFLLLAALFTLASCDFNEFSKGSGVGKPITFTANTYYQNGIGTRTEYSGEFFGDETKYERINWVDEDLLRIWAQVDASTKENGDYSVESHETDASNQQNSNAKVKSVGNPLTWLSDATHTIYALYPSPNTENFTDASKVSLNGNVITATIPATQVVTAESGSKVFKPDMNYAFMWAATQAAPGNNVNLGFKPLMTTFEFTVGTSVAEGLALKSFTLKTDNDADSPVIAGDFTAAISDDLANCTITNIANGATAINVSLGNVAVTADSPVTFTVFALPQNLTNLSMVFTLSDDSTRELALKRKEEGATEYTFITFEAGKKYRITNVGVPGDGWTYTLEEVEPGTDMVRDDPTAGTATKTIKSYKTKGADVEEVAMTFRYSPADDDGNNLEQWSADLPDWLEPLLVGAHTPEQGADDPFTLTGSYSEMSVVETETLNEINEHIAILKRKGNNGATSASPQDLALYDINNLASPRGTVKTANSYVVDKAGWYMFPLVYGNAIDWEKVPSSGLNVGSYYDGLGNGWDSENYYVLHRFRNYLNTGITSPYILDDTHLTEDQVEAVIVWEDVTSDKLFINTAEVVDTPTTTAVYKELDGTTSKTVPYIKFDVDDTNIRQGNAVIALREKSGEKRIIWSWHIWVTDTDLSTMTVETRSSTVPSNQMLKVNLGWCDTKVITDFSYTPRKYFVEVTQTEGNADAVVFAVTQTGPTSTRTFIGSATFYQYGRKDPFLPMKGELMDPFNKESYSPAGYTLVKNNTTISNSTEQTSSPGNVSYGIQNPHIQYCHTSGSSYGWVTSKQHNLWDVTETSSNGHSYHDYVFDVNKDKIVVKSIYDPCPPGFSVPNYMAFSIFTTNGPASSGWNTPDPETEDGLGYLLYTTAAGGPKMLFPYHGFRANGLIYAGPFYLINSKASGDNYNVMFNYGGTMQDGIKSNAYSVRPAKEIQ